MTHSDPFHPQEPSDLAADPALHGLLGKAKVPQLSAGFTASVLRAVENAEQAWTESPSGSSRADRAPRSFSWLARTGGWGAVAAALAVAAGIGLWHLGRSPENTSPGDDALISALQSLDLKSEDFAIVAQLGEVLEAELTADNALWLEPK